MLNKIKSNLGKVPGMKKLSDRAVTVSQNALDSADTERLWSIIREKRHLLNDWLQTEGLELAKETLTRTACEKMAGYVREFVPFPFRLAIKEAVLAEFLWSNRERLVALLQTSGASHA